MYGMGCDPTQVTAEAEIKLGTQTSNITEEGTKTYVYVRMPAAGAQYSGVQINGDFTAQLGGANSVRGSRVGFIQAEFAAGDHGWALVDGLTDFRSGGTNAASAETSGLSFGTNAGQIDSSGNTDRIDGLRLVTPAASGSNGKLMATYPTIAS